jgi:small subunit ribosomal protein S3
MGQKVHPYGMRLGIIRDWQSRWFADKEYAEFALEDHKIRQFLRAKMPSIISGAAATQRGGRGGGGGNRGGRGGGGRGGMDAGVSTIEIERMANLVKVTLHTARPGLIIGRGGRGIDEIRAELEKLIPRTVQLNVLEVKAPELDAMLVAESISNQIERRVSFKRAIRLAIARTMQRGGKGIKVIVGGRLGGAEIARSYGDKDGKIPLHTLRADIDYGLAEARTQYGNIGVKVWIYRGEILPGTAPMVGQTQVPRERTAMPPRPTAAAPAGAPAAATAKKGWKRVTRSDGDVAPAPVDESPELVEENVLPQTPVAEETPVIEAVETAAPESDGPEASA